MSLFALPFINTSYVRSSSFRPIHQKLFWLLLADCLLLGWIGCQPVEAPYVTDSLTIHVKSEHQEIRTMSTITNEQQTLQLADSKAWNINFQVWHLNKHYTFKNRFCEGLSLVKTNWKEGLSIMKLMAFRATNKQCVRF